MAPHLCCHSCLWLRAGDQTNDLKWIKSSTIFSNTFFLVKIGSFFQVTLWPYGLLCWRSCWKCTFFFGGKTGCGNSYCFCWLGAKSRGLYVNTPALLEEKLFAEISTIRKIDRLFPKLSEYLKAGAGVLLLCVLMLTEEQNIFLTCLKSHADRCSYSSVSCILCASKTVFFKWVLANAVIVEIFQWAFCLVK